MMDSSQSSTAIDSIPRLVSNLRQHFNTGLTKSLAYRQKQLRGLQRFLQEQENPIIAALKTDLGKPVSEALQTEIFFTRAELSHALRHLARWMKPQRVRTPLHAQPGKSLIYPEPLGVVLIIAPWNYPLQLTLSPLIGALAAGNTVAIKPSEVAAATSKLLATELPKYLDPACLAVIQGAVPETTALLNEKFDHIFYTGNGSVGRIVMTAAAKSLTPVTLELGGKSPAIVDETANLKLTAQRLVWAKFSNAGQTCVAPDYLLVQEAVEKPLLEQMKIHLREFYGDNPQSSPDYGRLINTRHYQRLLKLLPGSGEVYLGGKGDEADRYLAPTILRKIPDQAPIMADEIFGPILPVITYKTLTEALHRINSHPKPLSLYLFSESKAVRKQVIENTSSGSLSINYPMLQLTVPELPFGGVGQSGMGAYHGKVGFDAFSHLKAVLIKPAWFNPAWLYPPYSSKILALLRWLTR